MPIDDSTLTLGPLKTLTGGSGLLTVPALTIVWHPHIDRIGQIAALTNLLEAKVAYLSRNEPMFFPPGATGGAPLDHRGISKESVLDIAFINGGLELQSHPRSRTEIEVDGQLLLERRRVTPADLERGLIITVARRFVFCLHAVRWPIKRSPTLGLLGTSDAIEDVRRSIARVAGEDMTVLLRGESGTGKELAARALHQAGPRAKARFVEVNMADLDAERATAELFGYKKGAFTGATADVAGHFRTATGGTIFLDEIAYTVPRVQPKLLRVLDNQVVQPLGSSDAIKVDVRIVAATDAKLEQAVAERRFERSLFNRLKTAFNIRLPPLRDRREDVGVLLVHFLKVNFGGSSILQKIQDPDPKTRPWLSANDVASVALSRLTENVRSLKGLAQTLVKKVGEAGDTSPAVKEFLADDLEATAAPPSVFQVGSNTPTPVRYTEEHLVAALEQARWSRKRAAELLGVGRSTFYEWLDRYPQLRSVLALEEKALRERLVAVGGDLARLAAELGTSTALLQRRLARKR